MTKNSPVETAVQKKEMIDALESNFGNVTIAARVVGITPRTHYRWLKEDDAYSTEAENIKDICYRKIKDGLIQKALMKIEKGSTRVLLKMLGIFLKKMPEEMERASRINNVRLVPKIKYVATREEAQEIMRSRGEMPNKID
jgi:predicted transcriptional regulator